MKTVSMDDFDSLYRTFGPMVLRRCRFLLKDEEKALDAMQDVFVREVFEHLNRAVKRSPHDKGQACAMPQTAHQKYCN